MIKSALTPTLSPKERVNHSALFGDTYSYGGCSTGFGFVDILARDESDR